MSILSTLGASSAKAFSFGKTATKKDAYFNQVTTLLPYTGTAGQNNSAFIENAGSYGGHVYTAYGNPEQGTFSPYVLPDGYWGTYFNGSSDFVSPIANSSFILGQSSFTIEAYVNLYSLNQVIASSRQALGLGYVYWQFSVNGSGQLEFQTRNGVGTQFYARSAVGAIQAGKYYHIAATRTASGLITVYVNGSSAGGTTVNDGLVNLDENTVAIGLFNYTGFVSYYQGYVSNFRLTKGSVLYTSDFSPSSVPLTAVANTILLTCQSNRFKDNSTANSGSAFSIVTNGTPSIQAYSPFASLSPYSPSTKGGSAYFNGTTDAVRITANPYPDITASFTFDCWYYPSSTATGIYQVYGTEGPAIIGYVGWGCNIGKTLSGRGHYFYWHVNNYGYSDGSRGTPVDALQLNAWNHIAVQRDASNIWSFWLNGKYYPTNTNGAWNDNGTFYSLFNQTGNGGFQVYPGVGTGDSKGPPGYVSDLRMVANTTMYNTSGADITVPTAPLSDTGAGTVALLRFTNAYITDSSMKNDWASIGNITTSTVTSKWGTGSTRFNGGYLRTANGANPNFAFSTNDFTAEGWINLQAAQTHTLLDVHDGNSTGRFTIQINSGGSVQLLGQSGTIRTNTTTSISQSTWTHWAISRASGVTRIFIGGVQGNTDYTDTNTYTCTTGAVTIGISAADFTSNPTNAYMNDFRISRFARYTNNFTPPSSAFFTY